MNQDREVEGVGVLLLKEELGEGNLQRLLLKLLVQVKDLTRVIAQFNKQKLNRDIFEQELGRIDIQVKKLLEEYY